MRNGRMPEKRTGEYVMSATPKLDRIGFDIGGLQHRLREADADAPLPVKEAQEIVDTCGRLYTEHRTLVAEFVALRAAYERHTGEYVSAALGTRRKRDNNRAEKTERLAKGFASRMMSEKRLLTDAEIANVVMAKFPNANRDEQEAAMAMAKSDLENRGKVS